MIEYSEREFPVLSDYSKKYRYLLFAVRVRLGVGFANDPRKQIIHHGKLQGDSTLACIEMFQ